MAAQAGVVNALLVRYALGYVEVTNAGSIGVFGRIEGFLSLGNTQTASEATTIATALLADRGVLQSAVTAIVEPVGASDTPYEGFVVGDSITAPTETGGTQTVQVQGVTVTEDDMGDPVFTPQLGTIVQLQDQAYQRWLKRMSNGTLAGTVQTAAPATPSAAPQPSALTSSLTATIIHQRGFLATGISDKYRPPIASTLSEVFANLTTVASTDTVVTVYRNGISIGTLTIPAGKDYATQGFSNAFGGRTGTVGGDYLQAAVTTTGTGAQGLVVEAIFK